MILISLVALLVLCIFPATSTICFCGDGIGQGKEDITYDDPPGGRCKKCYSEQLSYSQVQRDLEIRITNNYNIGSRDEDDYDNMTVFQNNSYVGKCRYCTLYRNDGFATRNRVIVYQNNTFLNLCKPHATGFLCGECEDGYHHNLATACVKCDHVIRGWFIYIITQFVSITVMFVILFLTNISLVSGPLNASIFFAQMVSTTMDLDQDSFPLANITNSTSTAYHLTAVYKFVYGPWNLDFFAPFIYEVCLFKQRSYLYYFIAQYIFALYPLVLVGGVAFIYFLDNRNTVIVERFRNCFYCCYRLLPRKLHQSSRNVLASFVFLAYAKFSWLSTLLLTPNKLFDFKGQVATNVLLLDPNVQNDDVGLIIFGVVCIIFMLLLPTVLLFFRFNYISKYSSFLSNLLEPFQYPFKREQIRDSLMTERTKLQTCWHHIKRYDYMWVSSIYFILRILLLVVYLYFENFILRFIFQQVVCLIGSIFFIIVRPYPKQWNNKLDSVLFLLLAFFNTLSLYQYYLAGQSRSLNEYVFAIQYIIIFVPFVWMTAYLTRYFIKHCSCRKGSVVIAHSDIYNKSAIVMEQTSSATVNARIERDTAGYDTFQ